MTHHQSFGSLLAWDPDGGTSYSNVGQVRDGAGPNITRGQTDITDHDDAASIFFRTFLPGIPDPGDITFSIGFDPNDPDHDEGIGTGLLGDFAQDGCTLATWEWTLKTCGGTAIWTFAGFVNSWSGAIPLEGELTADLGVKISGQPTLTVT